MPSSFEFIKLKIIGIIVNESKAKPKAIIILTPFLRSTFTTGNYHTGVINSHVLQKCYL